MSTAANRRKLKIMLSIKIILILKKMHEEKLKTSRTQKKRCTKSFWVNPMLLNRSEHDLEAHLMKDLELDDGSDFQNCSRMTIDHFEDLLSCVSNTHYLFICIINFLIYFITDFTDRTIH